ncbi:MAG: response regulator transcription factor [Pirellulaceae bacterium]
MTHVAPTIFVIDDDDSVRTSLSRLLNAAGLQVKTFRSAEVYLEHTPHQGAGCIILDVCMGGLSGTDLQTRLAENGCDLPIIFLTGHGSIPMSVNAMKHGAVDFLTKPVDETILLDTIHQALANYERIICDRKQADAARERLEALTPRELEVMREVLTGSLNKQIAARLGIAEKTVKLHRSRVMEKIGVTSVAELVRFAGAAGVSPMEQTRS